MRVLFAALFVAACGGATPKPAGTTGDRAPADPTLRPAGDGWYCTQQTVGFGGGCFREESTCNDASDASYPRCSPQPTAYCHTHLFVPADQHDFFCLPTEAMCESRVVSWSEPASDYRDVSACAAWN